MTADPGIATMKRRHRITREEGRAFRKRWEAVNAAEREELRAMSGEEKLRQLAALMASRDLFDWTEEMREEAEVRQRWNRLRRAYRS
jgi:predicted ArsR family transcriptional regulator